MKPILALFEKSIQTIIESSIRLVPGQSVNSLILAILTKTREIVSNAIMNGSEIPNIYSIRINSSEFNLIKQENTLTEKINNLLNDIAIETKKKIPGPLSVELIADDELRKQHFEIDYYVIPSIIEQTAAMKIESKEDFKPASLQKSSYLILPDQNTYVLNRGITQIGRKKDNHIIIDYPTISRNHAQIRMIQGKYVLFDLNSTSGVFVNGIKINQMTLYPGDVISFAGYTIIYAEEGIKDIKNHEKTSELPRTVNHS